MFSNVFGLGGGGNFPTDLEVFVTAAVLVAVGAVLVAGRRADDPRALRPAARYLSAICVLTLFVTLYAGFGTMQALSDLVVDHTARLKQTKAEANSEFNDNNLSDFTGGVFLPVGNTIFDFSAEPNNDSNYAAAMASGLVAITAGGVFLLHARWRKRLARADDVPGGAVTRVDRGYNYGVCFVAAITAAIGLASAAFGIFEVVAPGVALGGNARVARGEGLAELAAFGALALVALGIFVVSWRRGGRKDFRTLRAAIGRPGSPAGAAPDGPETPAGPSPEPPEPSPSTEPPAPAPASVESSDRPEETESAEPDGSDDPADGTGEPGEAGDADDADRVPAVHWNGSEHESELSVN